MRRSGLHLWVALVGGANRWVLPGEGEPVHTKQQVEGWKFHTKSRQEWDYNGIDERINAQSQFRDTSQRPTFETGPRPDNTTAFTASYYNPPHVKKLHEYFDDYTRPGTDAKAEAARAVSEHWDAKEFYYPGEAWQRNRPSFRSVPAELLNRQTWYHWTEMISKAHEIFPTFRPRMWNPIWPPPGYKVAKLQTKREFQYGNDDPGLIQEAERWFWHKSWLENNVRQGPWEFVGYFLFGWWFISVATWDQFDLKRKAMFSNQYYPGRQIVRSVGEPKDWEKENWWWQEPLEMWPNQGEIWFMGAVRWKYFNHVKKQEEAEKMKAALSAATAAA